MVELENNMIIKFKDREGLWLLNPAKRSVGQYNQGTGWYAQLIVPDSDGYTAFPDTVRFVDSITDRCRVHLVDIVKSTNKWVSDKAAHTKKREAHVKAALDKLTHEDKVVLGLVKEN